MRSSRGAVPRAVTVAVAALASWYATTALGSALVGPPTEDLRLGAMWAVIATLVVVGSHTSMRAGLDRMVATFVSMVLCLIYLLLFGFHPLGLAVVVGIGAIVTECLGVSGAITTAGITTTVVLVVAGLGPPGTAWRTPIYRMGDTIVGIVIGIATTVILRASSSVPR